MGLDLHQQPRPSPRPAVSPEMQRSLELLQLSKPELIKEIEQELQENPALEIIYEPAPEDAIGQHPATRKTTGFIESSWETDADGKDEETSESDEPAAQKNTSAGLLRPPPESLAHFLLKQLRLTRLTPQGDKDRNRNRRQPRRGRLP